MHPLECLRALQGGMVVVAEGTAVAKVIMLVKEQVGVDEEGLRRDSELRV